MLDTVDLGGNMPNSPSHPGQVEDHVWSEQDGVNMGVSPLILPKTQLASGTNVTVRGTLVTQRPAYRKIDIDFGYPSPSSSDFIHGKYQGGMYYKPDNGFESLLFMINGRLFQVTPGSTTASFIDRTIPGDPNPISPDQAWGWQSEKWGLFNDGVSKTLIFDQTATPTTRRSTWGTFTNQETTLTSANVTVPAVGGTATVAFASVTNLSVGDTVTFRNVGTAIVTTIAGLNVTVTNLTGTPGKTYFTGSRVDWPASISTELPPGRMGAYVGGQNWISLLDGRQFMASDQDGASSGTVANNFRDAVLNVTQNTYLAGGGNFFIPGTSGDIRAMAAGAVQDASLGQGPLQVFTPNTIFSVNVPSDRLTWQDLTNPILGETVISYGALGQWAVANANSDFIYRSPDGLRSQAIARRDFNTWGSTPISREMDPILSKDPLGSLQFCSIIVFDNRALTTSQPVLGPNGVYWQQLIALNMDPVSSLRGKAPSIYDGSWTGFNAFQLIKGQFQGVERAFTLCYNAITGENELYEILKSIPLDPPPATLQPSQSFFDNDTTRIVSAFQTSVLMREVPGKTQFDLVRLVDGEVYFDNIRGTTDVQVWYRPDSYPCWILWNRFSLCHPVALDDPTSRPGYRTRIGLGEPSGKPCEPINNRPYRVGHWFQLRFVVTGPFRFLGGRIKAVFEPQSQYAKVAGCCLNDNALQPPPGTIPTPLPPSGGEVIGVPSDGEIIGIRGTGDEIGTP